MSALIEIVHRAVTPAPWAEGENIPWSDPAFSERMLAEHLCQTHDAASRRAEKIDAHVAWLHEQILAGRPGKVLDLACGPGLYTQRLAKRRHACVGVDWAPAAVAYATTQAQSQGVPCTYVQADVREAGFGDGFDLAMMLHGQLNVFRRGAAADILRRAHNALAPGGRLVLEMQSCEYLHNDGRTGCDWTAAEGGLFSERPYLMLHESFWIEDAPARVDRYYIIDAATGQVDRHSLTTEAYSAEQIERLLTGAGFADVQLSADLGGVAMPEYVVVTARREERRGKA
jgi:SAM-dependent methyltransferase